MGSDSSAIRKSKLAGPALGPCTKRAASHGGWLVAAALFALPVHTLADPVSLAPAFAGQFGVGNGALATFVQIDSLWRGSTVLWNQDTQSFGTGTPIGSFEWGTGLWGQPDWRAAQQAASGATGAGLPAVVNQWSGVVATVNHGNAAYAADYESTFGAAALVPFFAPGAERSEQENWTASYSGFIRVEQAGLYNFGVLNDDGFFLTLRGANGSSVSTGRDFLNPPAVNSFDDGLLLDAGLYAFDLGSWNRLDVGVVNLSWRTGGATEWTVVPTANLVTAVPEPSTALTGGLGLLALCLHLLRQRSRRTPS